METIYLSSTSKQRVLQTKEICNQLGTNCPDLPVIKSLRAPHKNPKKTSILGGITTTTCDLLKKALNTSSLIKRRFILRRNINYGLITQPFVPHVILLQRWFQRHQVGNQALLNHQLIVIHVLLQQRLIFVLHFCRLNRVKIICQPLNRRCGRAPNKPWDKEVWTSPRKRW